MVAPGSLFWQRYHGRGLVATITGSISFAIIGISIGRDEMIISRLLPFFVALLMAVVANYALQKKMVL